MIISAPFPYIYTYMSVSNILSVLNNEIGNGIGRQGFSPARNRWLQFIPAKIQPEWNPTISFWPEWNGPFHSGWNEMQPFHFGWNGPSILAGMEWSFHSGRNDFFCIGLRNMHPGTTGSLAGTTALSEVRHLAVTSLWEFCWFCLS